MAAQMQLEGRLPWLLATVEGWAVASRWPTLERERREFAAEVEADTPRICHSERS